MKKIIITALILLVAPLANAFTITPEDCTALYPCWTSEDNSQPDGDDIAALVGSSSTLDDIYKAEVGGADSGAAAGSYQTTFSNSSGDPEDALLEYLGGLVIDCSAECYLTVKDGNHSPALYAYDITGWDGVESIFMDGFWPDGGAISNVAIWSGGETTVPEPASLALLGLGLAALGVSRRKQKQA
jgi:hypothetical protein